MKKDFSRQDFINMLQPNGECLEWSAGTFSNGYGQTHAYGKQWYTHRLALHLEGVDVNGQYVLHSCDNRLCCNPDHLRLGTHADNMRDMVNRGRQHKPRGSNNGTAKLTEQDVHDIRSIRGMTQTAIADQYGVGDTTISEIINRKRWTHI